MTTNLNTVNHSHYTKIILLIKTAAELEISEAKSSAKQNNSVTLPLTNIAIIVCDTCKSVLQGYNHFANHQNHNTYILSNSH